MRLTTVVSKALLLFSVSVNGQLRQMSNYGKICSTTAHVKSKGLIALHLFLYFEFDVSSGLSRA